MDIGTRRQRVRRLGYCMNCLARSHKSYSCPSENGCHDCGGEHHTLLHIPTREVRVNPDDQERKPREERLRRIEGSATKHQPRRQLRKGPAPRGQSRDRISRQQAQSHRRISNVSTTQLPPYSHQRRILQVALRALKRLQGALTK